MALLSNEQVELVYQRIAAAITNERLRGELLDHFCCYLEEHDSSDFETDYQRALQAICPEGIGEIQNEVTYFLTLKTHTIMKKIIFSSGFVAAFCLSMSMLFRQMHYPGAVVLSVTGSLGLLISVATILIRSLRTADRQPTMYLVRTFSGFAAAFFIASGSIFKALWFPTANIQLMVGFVVLSFVFIPLFFYHLYQQSLSDK